MEKFQGSARKRASTQMSYDAEDRENSTPEDPVMGSGSVPSSNSERTRLKQEIDSVKDLIERCLQLYMNRDEVVEKLSTQAKVDPGFTTLLWERLEAQNLDFFKGYYARLKLRKQMAMWDQFVKQLWDLTCHQALPKAPPALVQDGIHHMHVSSMPMGTLLQQPPLPTAQIDSMGCGMSSCHAANGLPASENYLSIQMNAGNDMSSCHVANGVPASENYLSIQMNAGNENAADPVPGTPAAVKSGIGMNPPSVASSSHFSFIPEMSGTIADASVLPSPFPYEVANPEAQQLGPDGAKENSSESHYLLSIPWNNGLPHLSVDLPNFEDTESLVNYCGSSFQHFDSNIVLGSPEQTNMVAEFFMDSVPGPEFQSDEDQTRHY